MPSDQTEMSLLPALMQIPGEKKGIALSGILENMGKSWKESMGKKAEGGEGRELGLATEDLWLYFD